MSDDEIEFLDEDADIVQQCVQLQPILVKTEPTEETEPRAHVISKGHVQPLLVERPPPGRPGPRKKRKKESEDDSDYDPSADVYQLQRTRKRRNFTKQAHQLVRSRVGPPQIVYKTQKIVLKAPQSVEEMKRRDLTIRLPDFDDPLCLPVRAIVKDENDIRRLKRWNNLCLEQLKHYDKPLRPKKGETVSSKRTVVIRNVFNKQTDTTETSFWSKVSVENEAGETKADVVQSILPRYREKKILNNYRLSEIRKRKPIHSKYEVILTKEKDGQEDTLVAYKPDESLSMMFKIFQKDSDGPDHGEEERKRYVEEMTSCKMCASCYQTSWRGVEKNIKHEINCHICGRLCVSINNLMMHLKVHQPSDVKKYKRSISRAIAKSLIYHYQCRVCQLQFPAIKDLREHVLTHKGSGEFYCEVGDHMVY